MCARQSLVLIGWREWAALPDLGAARIGAKIDTGAKGSALHATKIKEFETGGVRHVEFWLQTLQGDEQREIFCHAPIAGKRLIKSSNGLEEERIVIETDLRLGEHRWKIDLTLANRETMEFALLIGRDALGGKFRIDPAASYQLERDQ
ncbi:MAG: ATP-dependent zinc protease [Alphaproteobacteria bacterium]|nr:ATP-dependent zinc protease [Alphaproteobacteria bacterium]